MEFLYWILLIGSPAFGLEVILLGGESYFVSRFDDKWRIMAFSFFFGLVLVGISILLGNLLGLDVLFLCVLLFVETFLFGKILSFANPQEKSQSGFTDQREVTDEEIKSILRSRGLDRLVKDSEED